MRWLDARGREFDLPVPARSYRAVSLAPDGKHAAVTIGDERAGDTWIGDLQRGTLRRLTFDGGTVDPVYTPDGTRVVYAAGRGGPFNLFWQPVDGGVERRLSASDHHQFPDSWSPDGRTLAYTDVDPQTRADLWLLSVSASAEPRETQPLARTPWDETAAAFSPDGRSVAYQSNESGRWEVLLIDRDAPSRRQAISADGGASAAWAPDGRTIFYRNGDAIMGVGVAPDLTLSRPRPVMTAEDSGPFVVGADGRFLSLKAAAQAPPSRFNVVLEWFAELERIVPAPLPKTIR
jgi:Tol biopolymer transport system component